MALEKTKVALVDVVGFAGLPEITGVAGGVGFAAPAEPTPSATNASRRRALLIYPGVPDSRTATDVEGGWVKGRRTSERGGVLLRP